MRHFPLIMKKYDQVFDLDCTTNFDSFQAHEVGRRAVKFVRRGQLSEAIECHLKAAKILYELQSKLSEDSQCKRSVEEQVYFHKRQAELAVVLKLVCGKFP